MIGEGSLAETLVIGDPFCALGDQNISSIIIMKSLICDAKEQRWIPAEKLKDSTIRGRGIKLVSDGESFTWDGKEYLNEDKIYNGIGCMPISSELNADGIVFTFDKQLLLDIGVTLQCDDTFQAPLQAL